jgi:head-tail adaptor
MARAGAMRDQVILERETDTGGLDAYGNPAGLAWAAMAIRWGDLREQKGGEALAAGRLEGTALATLRLRSEALVESLTSADRVRARGHVWAIVSAPIWATRAGDILEITLERGGAVE